MSRKEKIIWSFTDEVLKLIREDRLGLVTDSDLQGALSATLGNMYEASVLADRADCK